MVEMLRVFLGMFQGSGGVFLEPGSVDQDPNQVMAEAPHLNFGRILCGVGDGKNDAKLFVIDFLGVRSISRIYTR